MIHLQPSVHKYDKPQDRPCTSYMKHKDCDLNDHKAGERYPVMLGLLLSIQGQVAAEEQENEKPEECEMMSMIEVME